MHLTKLSLFLIRISLTAVTLLTMIWSSSLLEQATGGKNAGILLLIVYIGVVTYCLIGQVQKVGRCKSDSN